VAPSVRADGLVRLIFFRARPAAPTRRRQFIASRPMVRVWPAPGRRRKSSDGGHTVLSWNRHEPRYRQGVQGVSNRSNVFRIAFRFAAIAGGQKFDALSLYSTWKTALPALAKYVV
jgi:hypothetical protein